MTEDETGVACSTHGREEIETSGGNGFWRQKNYIIT